MIPLKQFIAIAISYILSIGMVIGQSLFSTKVVTGAQQLEVYQAYLAKKNIALVANQSTQIEGTHLIDTLLATGIKITKVFCPEHGFRGIADAGDQVNSSIDTKTGLPIISLYGKSKKPSSFDLIGIDMLVFDIQDVGVRFYTYISTLTYVMEACAENHIPVLVLDRPNPNGFYIDGPVLDTAEKSFVGMHPVPLVHGMTVGEFALMINGEKWLKDELQCNLSVIPCKNYTHNTLYQLPIKPSPNLPNTRSVLLYPSLGLFEGTVMSVGRGTSFPFQAYGHPEMRMGKFEFTPQSTIGAMNPKYNNETCKGVDLQVLDLSIISAQKQLNLSYLIEAYNDLQKNTDFFNSYFTKLAGTNVLEQQIIDGLNEPQIRASWQEELETFKKIRSQYLLYPDFE